MCSLQLCETEFTEATCVGTDHRNLVNLELQNALDAQVHVLPFTVVVAELERE